MVIGVGDTVDVGSVVEEVVGISNGVIGGTGVVGILLVLLGCWNYCWNC